MSAHSSLGRYRSHFLRSLSPRNPPPPRRGAPPRCAPPTPRLDCSRRTGCVLRLARSPLAITPARAKCTHEQLPYNRCAGSGGVLSFATAPSRWARTSRLLGQKLGGGALVHHRLCGNAKCVLGKPERLLSTRLVAAAAAGCFFLTKGFSPC